MCLIELPLLDRKYPWSYRRTTPTLERLDRVFIDLKWDELLPNTVLSSLTRRTSNHVPLKIDISTTFDSRISGFNLWVSMILWPLPGIAELTIVSLLEPLLLGSNPLALLSGLGDKAFLASLNKRPIAE
jgi:hypothetical protein